MASLTCSIPLRCSRLAAAISTMMALTRCTLPSTCSMVPPACPASTLPCATLMPASSISTLIWRAASWLRWASLRTSPATTAKPRPCAPARAASTAAFSARILVWKAMPSITPMMSAIFSAAVSIDAITSTTCDTATPPCRATVPRHGRRRLRQRAGLLRVLGILAHGRRQLLHRRGGLFERAGLLLGTIRQIGVASLDLGRRRFDIEGAAAHLADDIYQAVVHVAQRRHQLAQLASTVGGDARAEVAARNCLRHHQCALQRTDNGAADHDADGDGRARHQQHQRRDQHERAAPADIGLLRDGPTVSAQLADGSAQQGGQRPVYAANGIVDLGIALACQAPVRGAIQLDITRMPGQKFFQQRLSRAVHLRQQNARRPVHLLTHSLVRLPVLLLQLGFAGTQQHVFPLHRLRLEDHEQITDRALPGKVSLYRLARFDQRLIQMVNTRQAGGERDQHGKRKSEGEFKTDFHGGST